MSKPPRIFIGVCFLVLLVASMSRKSRFKYFKVKLDLSKVFNSGFFTRKREITYEEGFDVPNSSQFLSDRVRQRKSTGSANRAHYKQSGLALNSSSPQTFPSGSSHSSCSVVRGASSGRGDKCLSSWVESADVSKTVQLLRNCQSRTSDDTAAISHLESQLVSLRSAKDILEIDYRSALRTLEALTSNAHNSATNAGNTIQTQKLALETAEQSIFALEQELATLHVQQQEAEPKYRGALFLSAVFSILVAIATARLIKSYLSSTIGNRSTSDKTHELVEVEVYIDKLKLSLATLSEDYKKTSRLLSDKECDNEQLSVSLRKLRGSYTELEALVSSLEGENHTLHGQLATAKYQTDQRYQLLQRRVTEVEAELSELRLTKDALVDIHTRKMLLLQTELLAQQEENACKSQKSAEEVSALQAARDAIETQFHDAQTQLGALQTLYAEKQCEVEALCEDLSLLQSAEKGAEAELEKIMGLFRQVQSVATAASSPREFLDEGRLRHKTLTTKTSITASSDSTSSVDSEKIGDGGRSSGRCSDGERSGDYDLGAGIISSHDNKFNGGDSSNVLAPAIDENDVCPTVANEPELDIKEMTMKLIAVFFDGEDGDNDDVVEGGAESQARVQTQEQSQAQVDNISSIISSSSRNGDITKVKRVAGVVAQDDHHQPHQSIGELQAELTRKLDVIQTEKQDVESELCRLKECLLLSQEENMSLANAVKGELVEARCTLATFKEEQFKMYLTLEEEHDKKVATVGELTRELEVTKLERDTLRTVAMEQKRSSEWLHRQWTELQRNVARLQNKAEELRQERDVLHAKLYPDPGTEAEAKSSHQQHQSLKAGTVAAINNDDVYIEKAGVPVSSDPTPMSTPQMTGISAVDVDVAGGNATPVVSKQMSGNGEGYVRPRNDNVTDISALNDKIHRSFAASFSAGASHTELLAAVDKLLRKPSLLRFDATAIAPTRLVSFRGGQASIMGTNKYGSVTVNGTTTAYLKRSSSHSTGDEKRVKSRPLAAAVSVVVPGGSRNRAVHTNIPVVRNDDAVVEVEEDYGIAAEDTYGDVSCSDTDDSDTVDFSHSPRQSSSCYNFNNASSSSISSAKTQVATLVRDFLSPRSVGDGGTSSRNKNCNTENANFIFRTATRKASLSSLRRISSVNTCLTDDMKMTMSPSNMVSVTSPDTVTTSCLSPPYFPLSTNGVAQSSTSTANKTDGSYFNFGKATAGAGGTSTVVPVAGNGVNKANGSGTTTKQQFTVSGTALPHNDKSSAKNHRDDHILICDDGGSDSCSDGNDNANGGDDCSDGGYGIRSRSCSGSGSCSREESNSYSSNTLPPINQLYDFSDTDDDSYSEGDDILSDDDNKYNNGNTNTVAAAMKRKKTTVMFTSPMLKPKEVGPTTILSKSTKNGGSGVKTSSDVSVYANYENVKNNNREETMVDRTSLMAL